MPGLNFERLGAAVEEAARGGAAPAAYRFRQGILRIQDEGVQFKAMMREINGAVGKYREKTGKQKT